MPNPFNPETMISFDIDKSSHVSLVVYDVSGRVVANLADGFFTPGTYSMNWNGTDMNGEEVSSGIYIYKLVTPSYKSSMQMTLLR